MAETATLKLLPRGCGIKESMFTCEGQIKLAERFEGEGPTGCRGFVISRESWECEGGLSGDGDRTPPGGVNLGCWDSPMDPLEATQDLITPTVAPLRQQPSLRD